MRPLLALACLALVATTFAGCLEDAERYPNGVPTTSTSKSGTSSASSSSSRSATGSASATGTGTPGGNGTGSGEAPQANVTATPLNGTAPLNVTFTLNGNVSAGASINWTLSFGDGNATNGTKLPTTVLHTYAMEGNYTANLTVTDGTRSALANVTLKVAGGGGGSSFTPIHEEGGVEVLCPQCSQRYNACVGLLAGENEADCFYFELPPEAAGRTATIESSNGFVNVDIMSNCSGSGTGLYSYIDETGSSPYSFTLPPGSGCLLLYEWADFPPTLTVDIV